MTPPAAEKSLLETILESLWSALEGYLTTAATKDALRQAGAGPEAMQGAVTTKVNLPTFHTEPQPPAGALETRDIAHCEPELQRRYLALKADFRTMTGHDLFETCTWRSKEKQLALWRVGRNGVIGEKILTNIDGIRDRSRHNYWPSQAIDVCVDLDPGPGKHAAWNPALYEPLRELALIHGLVWGGDWAIHDYPHLELPAGAA